MALVEIIPTPARVRWDRRAGRPTDVFWNGHRLRVARLDAVRDERSAYPAARGPRVTFVLSATNGGRAALSFEPRHRRWTLEALEEAA